MGRLILAATSGDRIHVVHGAARAIIDVKCVIDDDRRRTVLGLRCAGGLTIAGKTTGELPMHVEDEVLIAHDGERMRLQLWHRSAGRTLVFDGPQSFVVSRAAIVDRPRPRHLIPESDAGAARTLAMRLMRTKFPAKEAAK